MKNIRNLNLAIFMLTHKVTITQYSAGGEYSLHSENYTWIDPFKVHENDGR